MELQSIQWNDVIQPEIVIGLFGVIVLVCGTRLYRLSVMAPGFLLGWYLSLYIISGVSPAVQLMMVLVLFITWMLMVMDMGMPPIQYNPAHNPLVIL